jgi:hypothetical protein
MQRIWAFFAVFFRSLFGSLSWSPPIWTLTLKDKYLSSRVHAMISPHAKAARARVAANPRRFKRIALSALVTVVVLGAGGYAIKSYLDSRPKPAYAKVTLLAPHARKTGEDKKTVLAVEFSVSAAPLNELNKPLLNTPELSPAVKGNWFWITDHTLQFAPDARDAEADWAIGQKYHIYLGKEVVAQHVMLEERNFDFNTEGFTAQLSKPEFYIDPQDAKIKKVTAEIDFNYPVKTEDLKKKVHLQLQDKDAYQLKPGGASVPVHITFSKTFEAAYLESEVLPVPEHTQVMRIEVEEGLKPLAPNASLSKGELKGDAEIAGRFDGFGLSEFGVIYPRNEKFEPEQVIKLESSIPAESEEVAKNIHAWLLPADHQPPGSRAVVKNYNWSSGAEVTPEVFAIAKELPLTMIPTQDPVSRIHSFGAFPSRESSQEHARLGRLPAERRSRRDRAGGPIPERAFLHGRWRRAEFGWRSPAAAPFEEPRRSEV